MSKIMSIHSFRGGTGKSNVSSNIAAQAAMAGKRVAVIDTDIQSPGVHVLCGFDSDIPGNTLNDYLYGQCAIVDAAHDKAAWFNFGPEADTRVRRMWSRTPEGARKAS